MLAFNAIGAVILLGLTMGAQSTVALYAVLAVGLFNSIMFPTIFTLAIANLSRHTGEGSGILCMACVGGAIVPLLSGLIADLSSIALSFCVPALCYLYIAYYGWRRYREMET